MFVLHDSIEEIIKRTIQQENPNYYISSDQATKDEKVKRIDTTNTSMEKEIQEKVIDYMESSNNDLGDHHGILSTHLNTVRLGLILESFVIHIQSINFIT